MLCSTQLSTFAYYRVIKTKSRVELSKVWEQGYYPCSTRLNLTLDSHRYLNLKLFEICGENIFKNDIVLFNKCLEMFKFNLLKHFCSEHHQLSEKARPKILRNFVFFDWSNRRWRKLEFFKTLTLAYSGFITTFV